MSIHNALIFASMTAAAAETAVAAASAMAAAAAEAAEAATAALAAAAAAVAAAAVAVAVGRGLAEPAGHPSLPHANGPHAHSPSQDQDHGPRYPNLFKHDASSRTASEQRATTCSTARCILHLDASDTPSQKRASTAPEIQRGELLLLLPDRQPAVQVWYRDGVVSIAGSQSTHPERDDGRGCPDAGAGDGHHVASEKEGCSDDCALAHERLAWR